MAHRVMAQATYGDIKDKPVHHKCGDRRCVNPAHLQVVRPIENVAEMLERNAYLRRIAELEQVLRSTHPHHPLVAVEESA